MPRFARVSVQFENLRFSRLKYSIYPRYLDTETSLKQTNPTPQNVPSDLDLHCLPLIQQLLGTSTGSKLQYESTPSQIY